MSPTVYISYSWSPESKQVADAIDKDWQEAGIKLIRDERDIAYKGSLKDFMTSMGGGDYVLVIINEAYLKSKNCMFEALELFKNPEFHNKILPIVLDSAGISDPLKGLEYIGHWEGKIAELDKKLRTMASAANLGAIHAELNHYTRIRDSIDGFIGVLKDMIMGRWPTVRSEKYKSIFDHINYVPPVKAETPDNPVGGIRAVHSGGIRVFHPVFQSENYNKLTPSEKDEDSTNGSFLSSAARSIINRMHYPQDATTDTKEKLNDEVIALIPLAQKQMFLAATPHKTLFELAGTMKNYGLDASLGEQLEEASRKIERLY
jgi:hypothetical protein